MKRKLSFLTSNFKLFFLCYCSLISFNLFSQKDKCVIYFKDNTKKEGFCALQDEGKVKFRTNTDGADYYFDARLIDKVAIIKGRTTIFRYKKVDEVYFQWLEEIIEGTVCLYKYELTRGYNNSDPMPPSHKNPSFDADTNSMNDIYHKPYYFVCYTGEDIVFKINTSGKRNFKKSLSIFFKDCPIIMERVQDETYKTDNLVKIINFYNSTNCGQNPTETAKPETK